MTDSMATARVGFIPGAVAVAFVPGIVARRVPGWRSTQFDPEWVFLLPKIALFGPRPHKVGKLRYLLSIPRRFVARISAFPMEYEGMPKKAQNKKTSSLDHGAQLPVGPKITVAEAQDAIAANLPALETLAWSFYRIRRELGAAEQGEDFPFEKPGPDHMAWHTSGSLAVIYGELIEVLGKARAAAELTFDDLVEDWEMQQKRAAESGRRSA